MPCSDPRAGRPSRHYAGGHQFPRIRPGGRLLARHRVAMIVLGGTFVLDLAVAVQAFGRRPSVFSKIRDEAEAPYEVGVCGEALTPTSLGFTIADLKPIEWISGADTVVVPGLEAPWTPQDPAVLEAIADAAVDGARMVSLCAGAFVLGQAGVLDGRTRHHPLGTRGRVPGRLPARESRRARHVRRRRSGALVRRHARLGGPVPVRAQPGPRPVLCERRVASPDQPAAPHRAVRRSTRSRCCVRARVLWRRCWSGSTCTSRTPSPCETSLRRPT